MGEPIIIYSNGDQIESDSCVLYEPFPEVVEDIMDDSQE
jgi:hypothetical protein